MPEGWGFCILTGHATGDMQFIDPIGQGQKAQWLLCFLGLHLQEVVTANSTSCDVVNVITGWGKIEKVYNFRSNEISATLGY